MQAFDEQAINEALKYVQHVLIGAENTCVKNLPEKCRSRKRALKKIQDTERIFGTIEDVLLKVYTDHIVELATSLGWGPEGIVISFIASIIVIIVTFL